MKWWLERNYGGVHCLPKYMTTFNDAGAGDDGGGGGAPPATFDPRSVDPAWLNAQIQNAIARETGGKGLTGLVNNNKELLAEKQRLKAEHDALQEKLKPFGDLDQAAELLKKFGSDEELKLFKEGKVDDLVKKRTDQMIKRHQQDVEAWQQKLAQREQREKMLMQRLQSATVDRELAEAAAKAGVHKTAIADVLARGRGVFQLEEQGEDLRIVPKDGQGQIIFAADGKTALTPEAWLETLKQEAPHFFPGSSGGGATGGPKGGGGSVINLPRQHTQAQFEAAYQQSVKEGKELRIAQE